MNATELINVLEVLRDSGWPKTSEKYDKESSQIEVIENYIRNTLPNYKVVAQSEQDSNTRIGVRIMKPKEFDQIQQAMADKSDIATEIQALYVEISMFENFYRTLNQNISHRGPVTTITQAKEFAPWQGNVMISIKEALDKAGFVYLSDDLLTLPYPFDEKRYVGKTVGDRLFGYF